MAVYLFLFIITSPITIVDVVVFSFSPSAVSGVYFDFDCVISPLSSSSLYNFSFLFTIYSCFFLLLFIAVSAIHKYCECRVEMEWEMGRRNGVATKGRMLMECFIFLLTTFIATKRVFFYFCFLEYFSCLEFYSFYVTNSYF